MRDGGIGRRRLLRLLAGGVAAAAGTGTAWGQPARGGRLHVRPRPKPPVPVHVPVIAIDPGHGGIDPGAIGPGGVYEKDIVFSTALELVRAVEATRRYRPFLTRRGDEFVALRDRVARARARNAELFLSLHADALPDSALRGVLVFTLSEEASDREAAALAIRENKADLVAGMDLSHQSREVGSILLDLARRQTNNRSLLFARALVGELGREVVLLEKPQRSAGFAVLTAPDIPSALVELGCLSNPQEERLLQQRVYQQRLAHGLLRAIEDYWAAALNV